MTTSVFSKIFATIGLTMVLCLVVSVIQPDITSARPATPGGGGRPSRAQRADVCGDSPEVPLSIDIGCKHKGNPIMDATFAIIRFLSNGAGLVMIGSLVYAGVQYTLSRGDPQATAAAINRIRNTIQALLIFIFAYALLNYLIPGAILRS